MTIVPNFRTGSALRITWHIARIIAAAMFLASLVFTALPARPVHAAGITVTTTADNTTNDAFCSLREAIQAANTDTAYRGCTAGSGTDIITLPAGTYTLTITGNNEQNNATGDIDILSNLTIQGATGNPANVIIQGGAGWDDKVIDINPLIDRVLTVTISGVTVQNGHNTSSADFYGGGIQAFGRNFGVFTSIGTLTLQNCVVNNNVYAGSLFNEGGGGLLAEQIHLNVDNCTFSNNSVTAENGGGISIIGFNENISITNSTFSGNTAPTYAGGAIFIRRLSGAQYPDAGGTITIDNNTFTSNSAGTRGGAIYLDIQSGAKTITTVFNLSDSVITGNTAGIEGNGIYYIGATSPNSATVNAMNNWWGCSTGPSAAPCNRAVASGGPLTYTPWLRDRLTSSLGMTLATNMSTDLTASFLTNSNGTDVPVANLARLIGRSVTWGATLGVISLAQTTVQASGTATGKFRASGVGTSTIYAQVDNDATSGASSNVLSLTIIKADTTTAITSDTPDPSAPGGSVTVNVTVTGAFGNAPTAPGGTVEVSDGVDSCTITLPAASCALALDTPGDRTLTATYSGDANFNGSTSSGVAHTVVTPPVVVKINSVADTGDGQVLEAEHITAAITQLLVVFSKSMNSEDAETVGNYHLLREGSPVDLVDGATYNNGTFTTTLSINGGLPLPQGNYTLTVSGSLEDTLGATIGTDFVRHFVIDRYSIFLPLVIR
jgi:CSLREA domain-containing protein